MKKSEPIYFINGNFVPKSKANVSINDLGITRAYGVFDFMITYNGHPFLLNEHIKRLLNSAKLIGINLNENKSTLEKHILETLKKNASRNEKTIKTLITGGESDDGINPQGKPTLAIIIGDLTPYPEKYFTKGVKAITATHTRQLPEIKNLDYIFAIKILKKAKLENAQEVIYVKAKGNLVLEGTRTNVFIIKGGKVQTSKLGVYSGITRDLVITLAKKRTTVAEEKITLKKLYSADEVFITSTSKEIMPVIKVDHKTIGNGKPGELTKTLMADYKKFVKAEVS